jgi:hypothetical protein
MGGRVAIASRIGLGAGLSRDGRRHSARLDLEANNFQAERRILGLRQKQANFSENKNPLKPQQTHETSPVLGATVVGMTYGACHGPSNLPAGIPGVSTTLG